MFCVDSLAPEVIAPAMNMRCLCRFGAMHTSMQVDGSGELELRELSTLLYRYRKKPPSRSSLSGTGRSSRNDTDALPALQKALDDMFPPEAHGSKLAWLVEQSEERQRAREETLAAEAVKRKERSAASAEATSQMQAELDAWAAKELLWLSERAQLEAQLSSARSEAERQLAAERAVRLAEVQQLREGAEARAAKLVAAKKDEDEQKATAVLREQLVSSHSEVRVCVLAPGCALHPPSSTAAHTPSPYHIYARRRRIKYIHSTCARCLHGLMLLHRTQTPPMHVKPKSNRSTLANRNVSMCYICVRAHLTA